jgi:hypothetical protein
MKYAVLIYQDERLWIEATSEQRAAYHAAHTAFYDAVQARAMRLGGEALTGVAGATTMRHDPDDRPLFTDGPFAETAEQLGGFYLLEAPDLDTVTGLCELLPHQYSLEVRPVADMSNADDWLEADQAARQPAGG